MKGFRYRQAYALLRQRIEAGTLPRADYRFVIGVHAVTPRVNGASLTSAQVAELASIVSFCTHDRPTRKAA